MNSNGSSGSSAAALGPSGRVVPVLFFLRCFFLFACGDGGGSSFGLAALEMFGLELRESAVPLAGLGQLLGMATASFHWSALETE